MGKLDKTKENIKINKLPTTDRKELFEKFVDAGGKIIDDKGEQLKNKKKSVYDREKQLAYKRLTEAKKQKPAMYTKTAAPGKTAAGGKPDADDRSDFLLLERLGIRFRLFLTRVTDFSLTNFNSRFLHSYNIDYIPAMMHVQTVFYELFKQDLETGYEIKNELQSLNYIYYPLIEKISALYNIKEIMPIVQLYIKSPESKQRIVEVRDTVLQLFKKIYILKEYQEYILIAFDKSLVMHMSITGGKSSTYSSKRKIIKSDLYIIFERLLPALYWLFCKFQGKIIKPGSPDIEEILGITAADKPTYRKKTAAVIGATKAETEEAKSGEKKDDKKAEDAVSDDVKKGLQLLRHFDPKNMKKLRAVFDESKKFIKINDNDKISMIYVIFQEFDREYAFLLTTNKIKYMPDYSRKGDINFKEKLLLSANDIKKCIGVFTDYTDSTELYYNTKNEKPLSNDQYIEYNKKLSALLNKRMQSAATVRMTISAFMNGISNLFKLLVDDIKGEKKIVENAGEVITFDISVETNRKLNKKTIYQSLSYAYFFTCAFIYRLSSNGDLSGELEFIAAADKESSGSAGDGDAEFKSAEEKKPADADLSKGFESQQIDISESNDISKPIADELDDLI